MIPNLKKNRLFEGAGESWEDRQILVADSVSSSRAGAQHWHSTGGQPTVNHQPEIYAQVQRKDIEARARHGHVLGRAHGHCGDGGARRHQHGILMTHASSCCVYIVVCIYSLEPHRISAI